MTKNEYIKYVNSIQFDINIDPPNYCDEIHISYYLNGRVINKKIMNEVSFIIHEKVKNKSCENGLNYYVWLDAQAGQIRLSAIINDINVQKNFGGNIVIGSNLMDVLNDIYEIKSIIEKNNGVKVFMFN